jgi:hypothetical protein
MLFGDTNFRNDFNNKKNLPNTFTHRQAKTKHLNKARVKQKKTFPALNIG